MFLYNLRTVCGHICFYFIESNASSPPCLSYVSLNTSRLLLLHRRHGVLFSNVSSRFFKEDDIYVPQNRQNRHYMCYVTADTVSSFICLLYSHILNILI